MMFLRSFVMLTGSIGKVNKKVLTAVLIPFCLLIIWYLYQRLDWQKQTYDMGWMPGAARSPYLAMKMLLEDFGVEKVDLLQLSVSERDLNQADAVFLPEPSFLPLPSQHEYMLEWIENGGNLVVGSGGAEFPPLLKRLGFSTRYKPLGVDEDEEESEAEEQNNEKEKSFADRLREENERIRESAKRLNDEEEDLCVAPLVQCNELVEPKIKEDFLSRLIFEGDESEILVHIDAAREIVHPTIYSDAEFENDAIGSSEEFAKTKVFYWDGDANGIRFVQANYGNGTISILTDPDIFSNGFIGHFDHAYLLQLLLSENHRVLVLEGKHMAPLSTLIWRHYREALLGGFLVLVFGIWCLSSRFGAKRDEQSVSRRSREEGMRAIGQWHWRRGDIDALLRPLRTDVFAAAARRWPLFKRWPEDKQYQYIADACELEISIVAKALKQTASRDEQSFVRLVQNLQFIRKRI